MPGDRHSDICHEQLSPADRHQLRPCRNGHVRHAAALVSEAPAYQTIHTLGLTLLFLPLVICLLPVITNENSGIGFAAIALSSINFFLFRHYERLLYTLRCPGCRRVALRIRAIHHKTYKLHCKHCGLYTDWHA